MDPLARRRAVTIRSLPSELYNDAGGDPALIVLGSVGELSHEPICLYQSNSDPLAKPYVYTAAKKHGKRVVANPAAPNCGATEQCVHKGLDYWQACGEYGANGIGVNR